MSIFKKLAVYAASTAIVTGGIGAVAYGKFNYDRYRVTSKMYPFETIDLNKSYIIHDSSNGSSFVNLQPKVETSHMAYTEQQIDCIKGNVKMNTYVFKNNTNIDYRSPTARQMILKHSVEDSCFEVDIKFNYREHTIMVPIESEDSVYKNPLLSFVCPPTLKSLYETFLILTAVDFDVEREISKKIFIGGYCETGNIFERFISKVMNYWKDVNRVEVSTEDYKKLVSPEVMRKYKEIGLTVYLDGEEL